MFALSILDIVGKMCMVDGWARCVYVVCSLLASFNIPFLLVRFCDEYYGEAYPYWES